MQIRPENLWRTAEQYLAAGNVQAETLYRRLEDDVIFGAGASLRLSLLAQQQGDLRDAVLHACNGRARGTTEPAVLGMLSKRLFTLGEVESAIECASSPHLYDCDDPAVIAEVGKLMTDAFQPDLAARLLQRARQLGLDSPGVTYLIGLSLMYQGRIDEAEHELRRCLARAPGYARAHWVMSKLRRWSSGSNNVDAIAKALEQADPSGADIPLLQYALFKEFDDLGDAPSAWKALDAGMRARRARLRYDPGQDKALFEHLCRTPGPYPAAVDQGDDPAPVFIVGMPRSGTTLLEQLVSGHPDVTPTGELHDFVLQLRWMCNRGGPPYLDHDLARHTDRIDWAELGSRYLSHTRMRRGDTPFFTDKMPANFLNIGYILAALPHARILHVVRDDMDVCFSNLKELFAGAYPHTYDQREMATYYRQYRRLMDHWHAIAPGRIFDVRYESLVGDTEQTVNAIFDHCGLTPVTTLDPIENRHGTVATASAVQVREPIHNRNIGQWERYGPWLEPMRAELARG